MSNDYTELVEKMTELISMSEKRIDNTNTMIGNAFSIVNKMTDEYTKQISKLQEVRDDLIKQNASLISHCENLRRDYDILNAKYDKLVEKMCINNNKSENNITVK